MMSKAPTAKQIWDEELGEPVHVSSYPIEWGEVREEVYLWEREGLCDTYWRIEYTVENQGDYNSLRDNTDSIEVVEVIPIETVTVVYKPVSEIINEL